MNQEKLETFYEQKYQSESEPWEYSRKAVEILRHKFVLKTARSLKKRYTNILDVGCSKGQLTSLLYGLAPKIYGIDVSETALANAKKHVAGEPAKSSETECNYFFSKENILSLSFSENSFDLVLLCDGIFEWFSENDNRLQALNETHRVLMQDGYAIICDYGNQKYFDEYLALIRASGLEISATYPFNDRLCYQFNSWFKAVDNSFFVRKMIESQAIAHFLMKISAFFGMRGSKHIFVVAIKK